MQKRHLLKMWLRLMLLHSTHVIERMWEITPAYVWSNTCPHLHASHGRECSGTLR